MLRFHPDKCKVLNIHNKWKESDSYRYTMEKYDETTAILEGVDLKKGHWGQHSTVTHCSTSLYKHRSIGQIKELALFDEH